MNKWSSRSLIYKISLLLSYITFLAYALAFSMPMWLGKGTSTGTRVFFGLWMEATGDRDDFDDTDAVFFDDGSIDRVWWDAVRGVMFGGMLFYVLAVLVSLVENCVSSAAVDYGITGVFTLLAGLCGAVSVIVTAIKVEDNDLPDSLKNPDYEWGFILMAAASGVAIILALVLFIARKADMADIKKTSRTADYVQAHSKSYPYTHEYNNLGYRGDEMPLANGVPYHKAAAPYNSHHMYPSVGGDVGFSHSHSKYNDNGYHPYGYPEARPGNRLSYVEGADLSNGFTPGMLQNSLPRGASQHGRGDFMYNGRY